MSQSLNDPSGVTMDVDFSNLLDEIESVAMQDEDEAPAAGSSLDASSFDDSAFDSPGKNPRSIPPSTTSTSMNPSVKIAENVGGGAVGGASGGNVLYATPPGRNANAPSTTGRGFFSLPASSAPIADAAPIFEPQIRFCEIRSTPVHLTSASDSAEGNHRRSSVGMRSQMKLMLMKQKVQEEEQKRDEPISAARSTTSLASLLTAAGAAAHPISASSLPHSVNSQPNAVLSSSAGPTVSSLGRSATFSRSPVVVASSLPNREQPPQTRLCNPTKLFYQKQQERTSMNNGSEVPRQLPPGSGDNSRTGSPAVTGGSGGGENYLSVRPRLSQQRQSRGSSPSVRPSGGDGSFGGVSPANDPDLCGSTGTSVSELDDLFEEIAEGTLENVEPEEVDAITGLLKSTMTMPQSNSLSDLAANASGGSNLTFSASCPSEILAKIQSGRGDQLTEDEVKVYLKDRQKKDNHNQIERRRRFNINDRIKELGGMLPKGSDPEFRANKGSILKATVDYIKKLEADRDKYRKGETREKETAKNYERLCKNMFLRIQELEKHASDHGWAVPGERGSGGTDSNGNVDSFLETMLSNFGNEANVSKNDAKSPQRQKQPPQNQNEFGKLFKASPAQSVSSTPVVTLSPPEYQGYSASPLPDARISAPSSAPTNQSPAYFNSSQYRGDPQQLTLQRPSQQQQQLQSQAQQNAFPIIQLAQDGNATITFVQCDPAAGNANGGDYFNGVVLKQEPADPSSAGQGMEYGVDCSDFAALVQGGEALMVDDADQMFSQQNIDETVREALDLL